MKEKKDSGNSGKNRLKEIFKRPPENMSRTVKWIFGLPLAYIAYIILTLFVPSFGPSFYALTARSMLLYTLLILCLLTVTRYFLKFSIRRLFRTEGTFRTAYMLGGTALMLLLGTASSFFRMALEPESFVFTFSSENFVSKWLAVLLLVCTAALAEELVFRSYISYVVSDSLPRTGRSTALHCLVSGLLFSGAHFSNPEVNGNTAMWSMLFYFIMGTALMFLYLKTGGIEYSLGVHIGNNLVSAWFFTYPNSVLETDALYTQYGGIDVFLIIQAVFCLSVCALPVLVHGRKRSAAA